MKDNFAFTKPFFILYPQKEGNDFIPAQFLHLLAQST
jgi:hypothetical protein